MEDKGEMECPECLKKRQNREKIKTFNNADENGQISVVSYNILADCHVQRGHNSDYTDPVYLSLEARHKVILKEITYLNGDVVCLQEVGPEYFRHTLEPDMNRLGYEGFFTRRLGDFYDEGCATFYLSSKFTMLQHNVHFLGQESDKIFHSAADDHNEELRQKIKERYIDRSDVILVTRLKHKLSDHVMVIANTHLVWGSEYIPDVRYLQMFLSIKILSDYINENCDSYVLCGDFNSFPTSAAYKLATAGGKIVTENLSCLKKETNNADITVLTAMFNVLSNKSQNLPLESSYANIMNCEPDVTNVDDEFECCLDYIFFGNNAAKSCDSDTKAPSLLVPVSILDLPPLPEIKKYLPPSSVYPSDHLPLRTTFAVIHKQS